MVLSFIFRPITIFNGMVRTMMIAVEAGEAHAVMFPLRPFAMSTYYIVNRAHICTYTAFYTFVFGNVKWFVGDKMFFEACTNDI